MLREKVVWEGQSCAMVSCAADVVSCAADVVSCAADVGSCAAEVATIMTSPDSIQAWLWKVLLMQSHLVLHKYRVMPPPPPGIGQS